MNAHRDADGQESLVVNCVYGHLLPENNRSVHRGGVSIVLSTLPLDGCDVYVYSNAFSYKGRRGGLDILLMLEPAVVLPGEFDERVWKHFDHILCLFDALPGNGNKFHKIHFPRADILGKNPITEIQSQRESLYPLSGRKNAICMISGNKSSHVPFELYSKRIKVARWFAEHSPMPFDVYGKPPFKLPNYRGVIPDGEKLAIQKQYRYSLCFENTDDPVLSAGYITEKILDCLESRTVPIYLGASNIEHYIPPQCFIDFRQFTDFQELDRYLHSISEKQYKNYIANIDAFVCGGGLRQYSESELYNDIFKILITEMSLDTEYFQNEICWRPGFSLSFQQREWKSSNAPVMWTWKHLSKAESPKVINGKIVSEVPESTAASQGATVTRPAKSFLIGKRPSIKVLTAGIKFCSGSARRGYDYWWWNLCDSLGRFANIQMQFFDYATEVQQRGSAGMSDRLEEIVRKEKPDVLFYTPGNLPVNILSESLQSITGLTDTQTLIWMDERDHGCDTDVRLLAPYADYIISTSQENFSKYRDAGFGPKIILSQWAFNQFTYQIDMLQKNRDISFIGSARGNRSNMIDKIRQSGLSVDVFGDGWSEYSFIPFYDMVRIFGQSKINLDFCGANVVSTGQIGRRVFEVTGCGGFLIAYPATNLAKYYEPGKEVVIASSIEELIDKCKYYLANQQERENIALCGYRRTITEHTWVHRLRDIFKHIGFTAITNPMPEVARLLPFMESSKSTPVPIKGNAPAKKIDHDDEAIETTINVMAYNQLEYTKQCVESILHYTKGSYELLLADNGSTDGTSEYFNFVARFHPNTRVIRNFRNRIAESVINHSTSIARGKYFVFVSNDTLVHEGWLECLVQHFESSPDVGWVGPRSNNISGPQIESAGYDTIEQFHAFATERSKQHKGENFSVKRLAGMLVITKKIFLERIGGADPDLPANGRDGGYGFSDDDLSIRFQLAGYKLLVANDVFIHHFGSVTAREHRPNLFGKPQNLNQAKYELKLRNNLRITIGPNSEISILPYKLDENIPVPENMRIALPRICVVMRGDAHHALKQNLYAELMKSYPLELRNIRSGDIVTVLREVLSSRNADIVIFIDDCFDLSADKVGKLIETTLCYPEVAVMVPLGAHAPSTHSADVRSEEEVDLIPYADMSVCAVNVKHFQNCLSWSEYRDDTRWFLQRRVRGEGYYIARANNLKIKDAAPAKSHPYDQLILPEALFERKDFEGAAVVYKNDVRRDPTFFDSIYMLGRIAFEKKNYREATLDFSRVLELDPHHILSLIYLAKIYLKAGNLIQAERVVSLAFLKQPGNPKVKEIVEEYEKQVRLAAEREVTITPALQPAKKGLVSIVITGSKYLDDMEKCLRSLRKHSNELHEILFIDTGYTERTKCWLERIVRDNSHYKIVGNAGNSRFSVACNIGIRASSGEYILLLKNSLELPEDGLRDMLSCLQSCSDSGVVGPVIFNAPDMGEVTEDLRFKYRHRRLNTAAVDEHCMLFRRELINRIGFFDEEMTSDRYAAEDFCLRARLDGYENLIAGDVFVSCRGNRDSFQKAGEKEAYYGKWSGIDIKKDKGKKLLAVKALDKADAFSQRGEIDKAVEVIFEGLKFAPDDRRLYYLLSEILIETKRYQEAAEVVIQIKGNETDPFSLALMGYCKDGLGLHQEAGEFAQKSLAIQESFAKALNLQGLVAYKNDEKQDASEFFKMAIEADPGYGEPYTNLGVIRWSEYNHNESVDLLERGFILSPLTHDISDAYYSAVTHESLFNRAEAVLRHTVRFYPSNKKIIFLLIDCLIRQDKHEAAMLEIERAMMTFDLDDGILAAALAVRDKIGPKLLDKGKKDASISLCMIVKNEEANIARCLKSVVDLVDEMIVVDTGSTDRTRDIARAFGAMTYDFEWSNDFSAARNYSLSMASGDWILVLDGDEVVASKDFAEIKRLADRKKIGFAYSIVTRNYVDKSNVEGWMKNDGAYSEEAGIGWLPSFKVRLFPNEANIRFENPVHETVEASVSKAGKRILKCNVPIHHYGKMVSVEINRAKGEEYYLLGRKKLDEKGEDLPALVELAIQAAELERYDEAVELWLRAIKLQPDYAKAHFNLGCAYLKLGKYADGSEVSKKAIELDPNIKEAIMNYANCELYRGNERNALAALEDMIIKYPGHPAATALLGISYVVNGKSREGIECFDKLRRMNADSSTAILSHAKEFMRAGRTDFALLLLETAITHGYANTGIITLIEELKENETR